MAIDSQLPRTFVREFSEANPGYRPGANEELDALFNPSISVKPTHVPMAGQIKTRLNTEMEYYWAFDRNGQNPNHERVEQLRGAGFEYATSKDVEMAVASTVLGESEIRSGDRRLMKIPKKRWLEIRKSQLIQSIMMTHPRHMKDRESGSTVMGANMIPGVKTTVSDQTEGLLASTAIESNAAQDLVDGVIRGNASKISKASVERGR